MLGGTIERQLGILLRLMAGIRKRQAEDEDGAEFLYRGIATRSFQRRFNLADHVRATGAKLENGLLHIFLERELPEAMKPRTIAIETGSGHKLLGGSKRNKAA